MNHANVVDDVLDNVAVDLVDLHAVVSWANVVDNALLSRVEVDRIHSVLLANLEVKLSLSSLVPPKQPAHILQFLRVVLLIEAPHHHRKLRGLQKRSLGVLQVGMGVRALFSETLHGVRVVDLASKRGHILGEVWGTAAAGKDLINEVMQLGFSWVLLDVAVAEVIPIHISLTNQLVDLLVGELVLQVGDDMVQLRCANKSVAITVDHIRGLNELLLGVRVVNLHTVAIVVDQREGLFRFGNVLLPALQALTPVKQRHRLRGVETESAEARRSQHAGRSTSETAPPSAGTGALRT
mmetsp:Transcript_111221/g.299995  ORF Transcript_111221/g.299995 Transcript_111221/m.299995 type:complete len:295 (+) Transcript_111221:582-1466(+)